MKKLKFMCVALGTLVYSEQGNGSSETLRVLGGIDKVRMNKVESLIQKTKNRYRDAVQTFQGTRIETDSKNSNILHIHLNGKRYNIDRNNLTDIDDNGIILTKGDEENNGWVKLRIMPGDCTTIDLKWCGRSIIITDVQTSELTPNYAIYAEKVYTLGDLNLSNYVIGAEDGFVNLGAKIKADNFRVLSYALGNYGNIWDGSYKKDTIDFNGMTYLEEFEVDRFFKKVTTQESYFSFFERMFAPGYNGTGNIYAKNINTEDLDINVQGDMLADSVKQKGEAQYSLQFKHGHNPYFCVRPWLPRSEEFGNYWTQYFNPLDEKFSVVIKNLDTTDLRVCEGEKNNDNVYTADCHGCLVKITAPNVVNFDDIKRETPVDNGETAGRWLHKYVSENKLNMQQLYNLNCFSDELGELLKNPEVTESGDGWIYDENNKATDWKYFIVLKNRCIPVSFTKDNNDKFCFFHKNGCMFSDEVDGFLNAVWDIKQHPELLPQQSEVEKEEEEENSNSNQPKSEPKVVVNPEPEIEEEEEDKGDNDQPNSEPGIEEEEEDKSDDKPENNQPVVVNPGSEIEEKEEDKPEQPKVLTFVEKLRMAQDNAEKGGWKAYLANPEQQQKMMQDATNFRRDNHLNRQQRQANIEAFNNNQSNNE